jgi:hypothetical protein
MHTHLPQRPKPLPLVLPHQFLVLSLLLHTTDHAFLPISRNLGSYNWIISIKKMMTIVVQLKSEIKSGKFHKPESVVYILDRRFDPRWMQIYLIHYLVNLTGKPAIDEATSYFQNHVDGTCRHTRIATDSFSLLQAYSGEQANKKANQTKTAVVKKVVA